MFKTSPLAGGASGFLKKYNLMKKHMQMLMLLADDFSIPGIFPQAQFKAKQVTNYT